MRTFRCIFVWEIVWSMCNQNNISNTIVSIILFIKMIFRWDICCFIHFERIILNCFYFFVNWFDIIFIFYKKTYIRTIWSNLYFWFINFNWQFQWIFIINSCHSMIRNKNKIHFQTCFCNLIIQFLDWLIYKLYSFLCFRCIRTKRMPCVIYFRKIKRN